MTNAPKTQPETPSSGDIWVPAFREAGAAVVVAAILLFIFYVFAFRWIHPEFVPFMDREATRLIAPGKDLTPISVGGYRVEGSNAIIEDFNGDEAILALPRSFQAEDYPFVKVNLQGFTRYSKFKILWRRADDLSQTHALEFMRSGDEATQISMVYGNENYRGRIADIALLFFDGPALGFENNDGVDISIQSIELRPFSAWRVAEQILEDWTNPPLWQGYSTNKVRGVHSYGIAYPNIFVTLLCGVGVALVVFRRVLTSRQRRFPQQAPLAATALALWLCTWMISETLRWQWRLDQILDTRDRFAHLSLEDRISNHPVRCGRFTEDCKRDLLPYF